MKPATSVSTFLVSAAFLLVSGSARAGVDDEFLETATLEQLDDAGYLIHGPGDSQGRRVNFQHVMDDRAAMLSILESAALWQAAAEMSDIFDTIALAGNLQLVELAPQGTSGSLSSLIIVDFDDLGDGPDLGGLSASMPGKSGLASSWTWTTDDDGIEHGQSATVSPDGTLTTKRLVRAGGVVLSAHATVAYPNGDRYELDSTLQADGTTRNVYEKHTADGQVQVAVEIEGEPQPAPKPKEFDKLPPADGQQGVYCPLYLPACRAAMEAIEQDASSPVALLTGYVWINPGTPQDDPDAAPLVIDNPDPLAGDPGMLNQPGKLPDEAIEISLPVLVLPPHPNEGGSSGK